MSSKLVDSSDCYYQSYSYYQIFSLLAAWFAYAAISQSLYCCRLINGETHELPFDAFGLKKISLSVVACANRYMTLQHTLSLKRYKRLMTMHSRRFTLVQTGSRWFTFVQIDSQWFTFFQISLYWFVLVDVVHIGSH